MARTATILCHARGEGPGLFGKILAERGFTLRQYLTPKESIADVDAINTDLLLVMGGPMGVYEMDKYPFLKDEIIILQKRLDTGKPALGVCLGAQLMAAALGEKIYKGAAGQEIGWSPVTVKDAAHPLRHLDGAHTSMFHWHGDTFDLPKDAKLLASSHMYPNQAYGVGKNALALQFHPEVEAQQLQEWFAASEKEIARSELVSNAQALAEQTKLHIETLNNQSRMFFTEWLESIGL